MCESVITRKRFRLAIMALSSVSPAYLTEFRSSLSAIRRKRVESAATGAGIGETPEQPYKHTAIWRFVNSCRRSGAIRARNRNSVRYAGSAGGV